METIREQGAEVWTISPDEPEALGRLREELGLTFVTLSDAGLEVVRRYGVLNEEAGTLPHPTAVVIDRAGVVRYIRVDEDYRVRPDPDELLEALASLD